MLYTCHHYPKAHLFFEEGSTGTVASVIKSGRVQITKQQGDSEEVIAVLGPGEIFGEMALLGAETHTATARAIENTEVINISQAHLKSVLKKADPILKRIISLLVSRLKQATDSIAAEEPQTEAETSKRQ